MFKVGDRVKVIRSGLGCNDDEIGMEVTITSIGGYLDETGYRVTPAIGNTESGVNDGYIGVRSFELVEDTSKHHPHHDLIIAWAKGAEIEYQSRITGSWYTASTPAWDQGYTYRIKPTAPPNAERIEQEMRRLADELKELRDAN